MLRDHDFIAACHETPDHGCAATVPTCGDDALRRPPATDVRSLNARRRLAFDTAIFVAVIVACRPGQTGIAAHEWLGVATIVPLLAHAIVSSNRTTRTAQARSAPPSWAGALARGTLFVTFVCAAVSGLMVSPALFAPFGIHSAATLAWHDVHVWSATATAVLLVLHAIMHAGRLFEIVTESLGSSAQWRTSRRSPERVLPSSANVPSFRPEHSDSPSHMGRRAAQAASERAMAFRTLTVVGMTVVVGLGVIAGVSLASPSEPASGQIGTRVAEIPTAACPSAGCSDSRCHASYGQTATTFYVETQSKVKTAGELRAAKRSASSASR